jgi:hypothetical protein
MGLGRAGGGAAAPGLALLATAIARWAGGWAWTPPAVVLGPSCCVKLGSSILLLCAFLKFAFCFAFFFFVFVHFHLFPGMYPAKHIF